VTESQFQAKLIKKLHAMFPGCIVLKNDSMLKQGILDLTILYENKWASLEVKKDKNAAVQPNQDFFVHRLNEMSYAAFVYPENEEEVLFALQQTFKPPRRARLFKP
jgi:hypothetical protein